MKSTTYSEKTLDHFRNPRNVGTLEGDDIAIGRVGNPVCGDLMEIYIKVSDDEIIEDAKFRTFGCAAAIATTSIVTELIKNHPVDQAMEITMNTMFSAKIARKKRTIHTQGLSFSQRFTVTVPGRGY